MKDYPHDNDYHPEADIPKKESEPRKGFDPKKATDQPKAPDFSKDKYDPKDYSSTDFPAHIPKTGLDQHKDFDFQKHDSDHVHRSGSHTDEEIYKGYKSIKTPEPTPPPVPTPLKDSRVPKIDPDKERAPVITKQPEGQHVKEGEIASFTVEAHGSPAPMFQWVLGIDDLKENAGQTGVKTATLTLSPADLKSTGQVYKVRVFNVHGEVLSGPAGLTVTKYPF